MMRAQGIISMSDESVRIMCPNLTCRKVLAVPASARGKTVRCRNCTTAIRIPATLGQTEPQTPTPPAKKSA
jgi:hypothetical protein